MNKGMQSRRIGYGLWLVTAVLLLAGPGGTQPLSFTDVTDQVAGGWLFGRSLAFGDYDNDGWPDLFVAEQNGFRMALYHNEADGRFTVQTDALQPDTPFEDRGGGVSFADYDNDGDLDLFSPAGRWISPLRARNVLLRNEGKQFRDVALEAGLTDSLPTDNATWLDYDRDGYLDLYTGNVACSPPDSTVRNKLYRSSGDGTFADVTPQAGLDVQIVHPREGLFCGGGSNGGMTAADFNDDGWPDLYIGAFNDHNRLFLSDGKGGFRDATMGDIGDPGAAYGVAVGDIDNDGDLDIFQGAGGGGGQQRSLMLANLGNGEFVDVTAAVGLLTALGNTETYNPTLADIDNDGDLDLLTDGFPAYLFLNNGDGTFAEMTSQTGLFNEHALADFDLDGFLDLAGENLFHTNGNDNHYLRVEVVGTQSNRDGIGARLVATSGQLRQMREIQGATGFYQHERTAHFGLGSRTSVDRLEVRWPSGQVDVLTDVPADQKIRVIEGQQQYHPIHPVTWTTSLPESVVNGTALQIEASVRPALFEAGARIAQVTADLRELGGPASTVLVGKGDGSYTLETQVAVDALSGPRDVWIVVEQVTSLGPYWTHLVKTVTVLPAVWPRGDLSIYSDGFGEGWEVESGPTVDLTLQQGSQVFEGRSALALQGHGPTRRYVAWEVRLRPAVPVDIGGYSALQLAFHPGEAVFPEFIFEEWIRGSLAPYAIVFANRNNLEAVTVVHGWSDNNLVDTRLKDWQVVEIPLSDLGLREPLEELRLGWNVEGTFYLDDLRLVRAAPPATAVLEERTAAVPQSFGLAQNYPNPFNSTTVISFALPVAAPVELAVYDLLGQQVATLAEGRREAGRYVLRWDGRDDAGQPLGSGVYLYRFRAADRVLSHKLLLLR